MSVLDELKSKKETVWLNPDVEAVGPNFELNGKKFVHIKAAQNRLLRFMPYIEKVFPETESRKGLIESELVEISKMKEQLQQYNRSFSGRLFLKNDAYLPISGSVKARGGIYEVLKFAEELAISNKLMKASDDHSIMTGDEFRTLFSKYTIQVGSTGNLGLSIGIMGAMLGFKVIVHMSLDAREWKKQMLRAEGVEVVEYADDYSAAVSEGRRLSSLDPMSHFIDDEASEDLFFGYATVALRLKVQLAKAKVKVDEDNPLVVFIPCGVGGAPGGITFGLKQLFGSNVKVYFVEPVEAPCFILGMTTGEYNNVSVSNIGLSGRTIADGLAVGRASGFVCEMMKPLVDGALTISDERLLILQRDMYDCEGIYLEPSACAGFAGFDINVPENATVIVWATGGALVPLEERFHK